MFDQFVARHVLVVHEGLDAPLAGEQIPDLAQVMREILLARVFARLGGGFVTGLGRFHGPRF
jgi:hypothetical protein